MKKGFGCCVFPCEKRLNSSPNIQIQFDKCVTHIVGDICQMLFHIWHKWVTRPLCVDYADKMSKEVRGEKSFEKVVCHVLRRSSIPQVVAGGTTSESVRKCYRYLTTCTHTGWCQQGCRFVENVQHMCANIIDICKEIFSSSDIWPTAHTHSGGWVTENKRQMQKY